MKTSSTKTRLRKPLLWLAVIVVGFVTLAAWTSRTSTPPFLDETGAIVPNSIAEERTMTLGGVEQHVLLRGKNKDAPLLVFVHGGPGASATAFLRTYNADLENEFLIVYWDQRGALNSFDSDLDPADMTIERMTADLGELIDSLFVEFNQDQVILLAHSWGTILGLEHAAKRPETVAAYIAVSQTTDQMASDAAGYEWALDQARAAGDSTAIEQLEEIGLPPYTIEEFITQRRFVNQFGGTLLEYQSDLDLLRISMATAEFAWPDAAPLVRGISFSGKALWDEQKTYNAQSRIQSIDVPVYFVYGRHDKAISPELGAQYFDQLEAPAKEFIWFENSAHAPLFEEPEKFNDYIVDIAQSIGILK